MESYSSLFYAIFDAIRLQLGIDLDTGKMVMNPFCEIALEEALKLKEQQIVREVVAISVGDKQCKDVIRSGLAMGADRGIAVITEQYQQLRQLQIARLLAAAAGHECPDLFLFGKQSIDTDANQTGQMVAGLLGWPQATCASSVSYDDATRTFQVTKEVDNGMETVKMGVPVVITADLRLNTPRYASLKNIMQAKKKNIEEITPEVRDQCSGCHVYRVMSCILGHAYESVYVYASTMVYKVNVHRANI